jgi:SAM-dependent methyltransferase
MTERLLDRTCCPACRGRLTADISAVDAERGPKTGTLHCPRCGTIAARLDRWRLDFHRPAPGREPVDRPIDVGVLHERRLGRDDLGLGWSAGAQPVGERWGALEAGSSVQVASAMTDALVRLVHHPSGGIAELLVDDQVVGEVDTYRTSGTWVAGHPALTDGAPGNRRIAVRAAGRRHPDAHGEQVLVDEVVLNAPAGTAGFAAEEEINLGNPRSPVIERYTERRDPAAWVLECGGGDRRRVDPRWVNFEYLPFELADAYGDIHQLPFADDSFDIVASQAVFEHLRQPFVAAQELLRVCRPGGRIVTECAFLQPLHGAPDHYFNMTVAGLRELFDGTAVIDEGWFGGLADTLAWIVRDTGLAARQSIKARQLVELARELDVHLDRSSLQLIASGVYLVVEVPPTIARP